MIREPFVPPGLDPTITVIAIATVALLFVMTVTSHPYLRKRYHNWFEIIHRFGGWTVVILFWAETLLVANANARAMHVPLRRSLASNASLWCLILITCSIILPWLKLRRTTVRAEPLSNHAVRLHLDEEQPATLGQGFRLSDRPLVENHAFAAIPGPVSGRGFSVIVSNAGDWTKKLIENPPRRLWTRGLLQYGAIRVATLFQPVVVVATGSGIAPCLSLFNAAQDLDCRVLWSASRPLATFGPSIMNTVLMKDPDAVIIDTRLTGRPDLVREAYWMAKAVKAEAVIVISNAAVTRKVVYGLEARGVPAFGPIFDS